MRSPPGMGALSCNPGRTVRALQSRSLGSFASACSGSGTRRGFARPCFRWRPGLGYVLGSSGRGATRPLACFASKASPDKVALESDISQLLVHIPHLLVDTSWDRDAKHTHKNISVAAQAQGSPLCGRPHEESALECAAARSVPPLFRRHHHHAAGRRSLSQRGVSPQSSRATGHGERNRSGTNHGHREQGRSRSRQGRRGAEPNGVHGVRRGLPPGAGAVPADRCR